MKAEYKLGNYTQKGWILKKAEDAYDAVIEKKKSSQNTSLAQIVNPRDALEAAVYAAFDAANEISFNPIDE